MPKKKNRTISITEYREERAIELVKLAEVLTENFAQYCSNVSPLQEAAKQCRQSSHEQWSYSLERLIFRLNLGKLRHTLPRRVCEVSLVLSISLSGSNIEGREITDPFQQFQLETILNGRHSDNGVLVSSWHLDRDAPDKEDGVQDFIHPCYHFQYGGRYMRDANLDYGNALILEPPRIAHPPMDAILAVDYVLTNYYSSTDTRFREEAAYINLLEGAQSRIWRPYVEALAAQWMLGPNRSPWQAQRIWPTLMNPR